MANRIGIKENTTQIEVSGARVAFDARSTKEANETRDPRNFKAEEKSLRTHLWKLREAEKRDRAADAA
jgi:hypothetical protein